MTMNGIRNRALFIARGRAQFAKHFVYTPYLHQTSVVQVFTSDY